MGNVVSAGEAHIFRIRHGKGHVIPVLLPDVRQRGKEPVKQRGKLLHLLIRRIRIPVNPRGIKKLPVYLTKYLLALVRAQILIENPRIPGLLHNVRLERSCRLLYWNPNTACPSGRNCAQAYLLR